MSDLRYVQVLHYGFDGKVKEGELIVNKKIAKKTVKVFYALYQKKYRIERMRLIDDYGANDEKSMAANNTSAFNYRVISGTTNFPTILMEWLSISIQGSIRGSKEIRYHRQMGRCINRERRQNVKENIRDI